MFAGFFFCFRQRRFFFFLRYRYFWSALLTERTLETKHSCERTFTREGSCLYTIAALLAACRRDPFFIRAAFSFRFKLLRHCSSLWGSLTQFYFFLYLWVRTLELFTFFFFCCCWFLSRRFLYTAPLLLSSSYPVVTAIFCFLSIHVLVHFFFFYLFMHIAAGFGGSFLHGRCWQFCSFFFFAIGSLFAIFNIYFLLS